jgi:hypothetical protein
VTASSPSNDSGCALPGEGLSLTASELYPFICVRDPYFALEALRALPDGSVTANVTRQQPLLYEAGPLAAAEAGRHLAILGSCAAALIHPVRARHYYIARQAQLQRVKVPVRPALGQLSARATAVLTDKRSARAFCELDCGGIGLFTLEVSYAVLSEALFHRLYGAHARELRSQPRSSLLPFQRKNPYGSAISLRILESDQGSLRATLGVITPEMCAGHFPRHPCVPVAILMQSLSHAAGELFSLRAGAPLRYVIRSADVDARELAFAGTEVWVEARHVGPLASGEIFQARAFTAGDRTLGELRLVLEER